MTRTLVLLLISTLYLACNQESNGPCDYHQYEALAKVTNIEPFTSGDKQLFHVSLKFNSSNLKNETQYLEKLKNIEIDSTFIALNKVTIGNSYQTTVSEIKEGNCTPLYVSFNHNFREK